MCDLLPDATDDVHRAIPSLDEQVNAYRAAMDTISPEERAQYHANRFWGSDKRDLWNNEKDMEILYDKLPLVKTTLLESTNILCDNLRPDDILRSMKSKCALTQDDVTEIKRQTTATEQVDKLIEVLMRKPVSAYSIFMDILQEERPDLYSQIKIIEKKQSLKRKHDTEKKANKLELFGTKTLSDKDIEAIVDLLKPNELRRLFKKINITTVDIQEAIKLVDLDLDHKHEARLVFRRWREVNGRQATRQKILDYLITCRFRYKAHVLEDIWRARKPEKSPEGTLPYSEHMGILYDKLPLVKKTLLVSTNILCANLKPDDTLRSMKSKDALTQDDVTEIKKQTTATEQIDKLIEVIMRKPVSASSIFMDILQETRPDLYSEVKTIEKRQSLKRKYDVEDEKISYKVPVYSDVVAHNLSISYKNLKMVGELGKGVNGPVYAVKFTEADGSGEIHYQGFKEAAAKSISKEDIEEADKMQSLRHTNIVRLLGIIDAEPTLGVVKNCYLLMEKGEMSLFKYLQDRSGYLTRLMQHRWALEICEAVKYVHDKHIVHRDIKPANVIYFKGDVVKLTDFGISEETIVTKTTIKGRGTFPYLAPEVDITQHPKGVKGQFSKASDIYSLGLLLWQLFSRDDIPFPLPPDIPDDFPESLKVLLPRTWQTNPHKRPHIVEIISALENDNFGV